MADFNPLSREGANLLARQIEDYWRERGYYTVQCRVEAVRGEKGNAIEFYAVRSNMVGGLPPAAPSAIAA